MFNPEFVHLYSHEQLAIYRKQYAERVEALTALVLAGKPRIDGLTAAAEQLKLIEAEIGRRLAP